jgi:beta-lactamase regulating signal transducer with metallopeptidase domain/tetratricopeptide (TPR) repeat protein
MDPMIEIATRLQAFGLLGSFVLIVIKATLILLIARLVVAAIGRASAAVKHLILTAALCGVIALPLLTFLVPAWRLALLPTSQDEARQTRAIGSTGDEQEEPGTLATAISVARATGVVPAARLSAMQSFLQAIRNSWQGLVLLIIGAVSALLLGRMFIGIFGVGVVARRAGEVDDDATLLELDRACDQLQLARPVRLLRSADVTVPVVWGYFRPILLLPADSTGWTAERLRVVLLHELAHVKRCDGITLLVTKAAVAIFWFHPMMWTLEAAARRECERACDDLVLAGGTKASDYAEHLLSIAKTLPQFDPFKAVTLAMSRKSQLEGRLLSILQPHVRRRAFSSRGVYFAAAFVLFFMVPLAGIRLVAAPGPEEQKKKPVVEIGPTVAAKVSPETVLAQFEKMKHEWPDWHKSGDKGEKREPRTGKEWYDRGYEYHNSDRYPEAIEAFKQAIARDYRVDASKYNIACGYALMDDAPNAVKWLRDAMAAGFDSFSHIGNDSDLDPIRSSPEFRQLVSELRTTTDDEEEVAELTERVDETEQKLDELKQETSADGDDWFDVGLDLLRLRRIDESIEAFQRAIDLGEKTSTSMYNIACAYSLKGDINSSMAWLEKAINEGFDSADKLANDPDLNNVRKHPQFAGAVRLASELSLNSWRSKKHWISSWFADDEEEAWREQLSRYRALTQKYPTAGRAWFNLGYAQLQAGENQASAQSFAKAMELGYRPGTSAYNTACAHAKAGNVDAAFDWLNRARSLGFKLYDYLDDDSDLENLHSDPRYTQLMREVRVEEKDE